MLSLGRTFNFHNSNDVLLDVSDDKISIFDL